MSFNLDSRHRWQRQASTVAFPGRWRVATRWLAGCPPWRIHLSEGSRILLANNSMPVTFPMSLHPPHILGLPDAEDGYWFLGPFFICQNLSYLGFCRFPFFVPFRDHVRQDFSRVNTTNTTTHVRHVSHTIPHPRFLADRIRAFESPHCNPAARLHLHIAAS